MMVNRALIIAVLSAFFVFAWLSPPPQSSQRLMAEKAGISMSSVGRIWKSHGLKPHRISTFKVSNDTEFAEKLEAIVGLYISPPDNAIVFSCDEKSQIQALDRTQPGLPMKKGRAATMTHDYKRNGTTTLFAALNTLTGEVLGTCAGRHRHQEWLSFLRQINTSTPKDKEIHIICDNYATHKHPKAKRSIDESSTGYRAFDWIYTNIRSTVSTSISSLGKRFSRFIDRSRTFRRPLKILRGVMGSVLSSTYSIASS